MDSYDKQHYSPSKTLQYEQCKIAGKNQHCPDRKIRSGQHDTYPEKTLETRGSDAPKLWFVVNVIVLLLNNPRYIFIVRRLSIFGINLNVSGPNSISKLAKLKLL